MLCILTEKVSARRNFETALGATYDKSSGCSRGTYAGEEFVLVNSVGHIMSFPKNPDELVSSSNAAKYKSWDLANLPWDETDFHWKKGISSGKKDVYNTIAKACRLADEVVIATDDDPTGEGTLLADEILLSLNLNGKVFSRMFFVDEAAPSIQKAFKDRIIIPKLEEDPDYIKADYRSKWDYLSMQFSRIATKCGDGRSVLRNGRLKSFMVSVTGDGLAAIKAYKKIPYYQNAFKDDKGNWYTIKDADTYPTKDDVPDIGLHQSDVVVDSKEMKRQAPPKLLDLLGLSAELSSKGIKAKEVLAVYQKMYEDQVVSYPRTEDKEITPEQFNELLPHVDDIAELIGIDAKQLTHRDPRSTHVKTGGSHGANRPGPNIPKSLDQLDRYGACAQEIYRALAKSFLTMFCEDYEYQSIKGHVADFPEYKTTVSVPFSYGYKALMKDEDEKEESNDKGIGSTATPQIKEGFPKRPPTPTVKWLKKQLEKHNVGTGATRTSCLAEVTSTSAKFPLMKETKGKLTMTKYGDMNYLLLKDTHIGSCALTEALQGDMERIAKGEARDIESLLHGVQRLVMEDLETMKNNAPGMRKALGVSTEAPPPKDKVTGVWNGKEVSFNAEWSGHRFSKDEIAALLAGAEISFEAWSKRGKPYIAKGKLAKQKYNGRTFVGFKPDFGKK